MHMTIKNHREHREILWFKLSLRGIARSKATQQSEAIHNGIASTIIPANDNDHITNLGSVLLEAIPQEIASDCLSQCLATTTFFEY